MGFLRAYRNDGSIEHKACVNAAVCASNAYYDRLASLLGRGTRTDHIIFLE